MLAPFTLQLVQVGKIRAMWEAIVYLQRGKNKDASLPHTKDLCLMSDSILFLCCQSSVTCSPSTCTVINPDKQRGEWLMAQVSLHHLFGKVIHGYVCKAWGPAGHVVCWKPYSSVFRGKRGISMGRDIFGMCLWDLCCSVVGSHSLWLVGGALHWSLSLLRSLMLPQVLSKNVLLLRDGLLLFS